jgi:hypothetical protein
MTRPCTIGLCVCLALAGFVAALPSYAQEGAPDGALRAQIVGRWGEGDAPYGVVGFGADGVYRMWVYESPTMEHLIGQAKGTWRIEGGKLRTTISETSPRLPPADPDYVHVEGIFQITGTTLTLVDRNGTKYTKEKITK